MTMQAMSLRRFQAILAAYGARPERWPAPERGAAEALAASSPAARALMEEAAALDVLLDTVPAPAVAPALRAAIMDAAPGGTRRPWLAELADGLRSAFAGLGGYRVMGPVMAASLVLGVIVGGAFPIDPGSRPDLLQLALMDQAFEGY